MTETRVPQNPPAALPPGAAAATPPTATPPLPPEAVPPEAADEMTPEQKRAMIFIVIAIVVLVAFTIGSIVFLLRAPAGQVAQIRDVFIILLAVQSLLIGLAMVVLIVQLARLINLLQNEIKPILNSTNETVSYLRGTTTFLSENLTEPVIKLNEYLAGLSQFFYAIGLARKSPKPKSTNNPFKGE